MKVYVVCRRNNSKYYPIKVLNSKVEAEEYVSYNSSSEKLYIDEVETRMK